MIIALQTLVYFREALLAALERAIKPYYTRITLAFSSHEDDTEEEEPDEQVFSEFDDEKGVIFFPPMYAQRYAAVSDCLMDERWQGKLEKVVDFGYHDISFIKYLKDMPGVKHILGVDIESMFLRCSGDLFGCEDGRKRENSLQVTLFQGNAADPDYRLIGCDAVVAIEMIEHMLPHDLDRLVHNVFGFIKPWIAIFTTPNGDFNVLFKALEKNGLRRMDHFFEWSREQFNDWCSNIVVRYPLYTVVCQGIGPGPPGTLHHGCCSQLALFINKDYHKQKDLNIDSLVLVPKLPNPKRPMNELVDCWESADNTITENYTQTADMDELISLPIKESLSERLYIDEPSCMRLVTGTNLNCDSISQFLPMYVDSTIAPYIEEEYVNKSDKTLQCNLDTEFGKNFLMFDEYQCLDVKEPRRMRRNRVYEIEDVASRLNCSTHQVKKFSKTTQDMMAKNKIDSLVHTQEVVDEIRNLTKTLNITKCEAERPDESTNVWCNINWGDNAPYWNQFYQIVAEYTYPFQEKTDESRVLDLITTEISRMTDSHLEEASCKGNRLEVPMSHLMSVVKHITGDVDMVRDLLEWNGYEIVDDVLIHSQFVIGPSVATHNEDSQDVDTNLSDVVEVAVADPRFGLGRGGSLSPLSLPLDPLLRNRCLRRALDTKVRNLRTILTADEDITMELDNVMCRLMKLALRTRNDCSTPPPLKWMQCKLLDLLTLTEKAIEYRKKHLIENSWKAIEFGEIDHNLKLINLTQDDTTTMEIVNKYCHIISPTDASAKSAMDMQPVDDGLSGTSVEFFKELEFVERDTPRLEDLSPFTTNGVLEPGRPELNTELNSIEKTEAWLNDDVVVVPSDRQDMNYITISSEDADSMCNNKHMRPKSIVNNKNIEPAICVSPLSKSSSKKHKLRYDDKKKSTSNTRITKKGARSNAKISGKYNIGKNCSNKITSDYPSCIVRARKMSKANRCLTMQASKPIPESLIDLCHPELKVEKCIKDYKVLSNVDEVNNVVIANQPSPIEYVEDNLLLDIIMNNTQSKDTQETLALHKSIETVLEKADNDISDKEKCVGILCDDIDLSLCTKHEVSAENIYSKTIFLNDINEPSTSKGIRHNISMDVQCGPDSLTYPMLSASTSLVRLADPGIKIHDEITDTTAKSNDFGTTTQDTTNDIIITPRSTSIGIKIKDSDVNICATNEDYTLTQELNNSRNLSPDRQCRSSHLTNRSPIPRSWSPESRELVFEKRTLIDTNTIDFSIETELLKSMPSNLKTEDSGSGVCTSVTSFQNTSDILSQKSSKDYDNNVIIENLSSSMKDRTSKLCCAGIDVHSYKEKQESVDIVYQGEWQNYRLKSARQKAHNKVLLKKINDSVIQKQNITVKIKTISSKDRLSVKKLGRKERIINSRKPLEMRIGSNESKKGTSNLPKINKDVKTTAKPLKPFVNVAKVSSKIGIRAISSKNLKSAFTAKKPPITATVTVKKENGTKNVRRSYVPMYLLKIRRQNADISAKKLNKSMSSVDQLKKRPTKGKTHPLIKLKTDQVKKDLLNFRDNIATNTYMVFHNKQQDNNCSSPDKQQSTNIESNENNSRQDSNYAKRERSPQSLNSSTCSSLNSIATVRAITTKSKNMTNRRHSTSHHKSGLNTSESDSTTPTKTKKGLKRCKSARKSDSYRDTNNKENIPDSTENFANKENDKFFKSHFAGKHKNVCIAQLKTERISVQSTTHTLSKHKTSNKSNVKIPTAEETDGQKPSLIMSPTRQRSSISESSSINNNNPNVTCKQSECADMVLKLKPQELTGVLSGSPTGNCPETVDNSLLTEWIQNLNYGSETSSCMNYVVHLIDDMLHSVIFDNITNARGMTGSQVDVPNARIDINDSACSFRTATEIDNLDNTFTESDITNCLNCTFESVIEDEAIYSLTGTKINLTDLDLRSMKENVISPSKHSEYHLAGSVDTTVSWIEDVEIPAVVFNPTSVTDIFERKDAHLLQKPAGVLANQAFSGFSLDGEMMTGDQSDPIALIDSETGSFSLALTERQATSEELFISARSSESYESCLIEEDAVVPNWLFQIISQQQSQIEESQPLIGPQPQLMIEPSYDINGNTLEPSIVGVDTGAGDGRGIHSDQSQDSSGRGTSLSSSDTSSSRVSQNEDIGIDSLAYTDQLELAWTTTSSSDVGTTETREANLRDRHRNMEDSVSAPVNSHSRRRPRTQFNLVSDIDADVSSIDTDVPDSSDNNL